MGLLCEVLHLSGCESGGIYCLRDHRSQRLVVFQFVSSPLSSLGFPRDFFLNEVWEARFFTCYCTEALRCSGEAWKEGPSPWSAVGSQSSASLGRARRTHFSAFLSLKWVWSLEGPGIGNTYILFMSYKWCMHSICSVLYVLHYTCIINAICVLYIT